MISTNQEFVLNVYLITPAGDTAFRGGPTIVTPSTNPSDPVLVPVDLRYVGIGFDAAGVRITSDPQSIYTGDSAIVVAEAFDSSGNPIPNTPIGWASLDPLTASVPDSTVGLVIGESQRGTARITATLVTLQSDTTTVDVQPVPSQLPGPWPGS